MGKNKPRFGVVKLKEARRSGVGLKKERPSVAALKKKVKKDKKKASKCPICGEMDCRGCGGVC